MTNGVGSKVNSHYHSRTPSYHEQKMKNNTDTDENEEEETDGRSDDTKRKWEIGALVFIIYLHTGT